LVLAFQLIDQPGPTNPYPPINTTPPGSAITTLYTHFHAILLSRSEQTTAQNKPKNIYEKILTP